MATTWLIFPPTISFLSLQLTHGSLHSKPYLFQSSHRVSLWFTWTLGAAVLGGDISKRLMGGALLGWRPPPHPIHCNLTCLLKGFVLQPIVTWSWLDLDCYWLSSLPIWFRVVGLLSTYLYHSWITWGAAGWQTCSKSDSSVSIDPFSCLDNIG